MASKHGEKHSPLEQFEIVPYNNVEVAGYNISFTNSSMAMVITVALICIFLTLTVNTRSIIPSRLQLISEMIYSVTLKFSALGQEKFPPAVLV